MDAKEDSHSSRTLASFCSKTEPATQVSQRNDLTEGRDGREDSQSSCTLASFCSSNTGCPQIASDEKIEIE